MNTTSKEIRILKLLRNAFEVFRKNDPLRMAGATAFFTTFALPAVLLILIQVFGLILSPRFMTHRIFQNLGEIVGKSTAGELHRTLFNVRHLFRNWYEAVLGFLFLLFVATTLLRVIKDSLNQLWNIRTLDHLGFRFELMSRGKSILVILLAGILFLIVLLSDGILDMVKQEPNGTLQVHASWTIKIFRQVVSFILISVWFSLLFKFLTDGRPSWKTVLAGGSFTGLFFTLGKLLLQWFLSYNSMETIYGASTASALLLLFVFYSSFIFYFGACFTKEWAELYNKPIPPAKHAEKYEWSPMQS